MLAHDVFNRTDDYLPPVDLPTRTNHFVTEQGWDPPHDVETPDGRRRDDPVIAQRRSQRG